MILEEKYSRLRLIAARLMRQERNAHTLQPTALVHEAVLRLSEEQIAACSSDEHLYNLLAGVMRHVLVDHARRRLSRPRAQNGWTLADWNSLPAGEERNLLQGILIDRALDRLRESSPRLAQIVELRYFLGCGIEETAGLLHISPSMVKQEWAQARKLLFEMLQGEQPVAAS